MPSDPAHPAHPAGGDVDLTIRPAVAADADALAALFISAREAAYPSMPRSVHPAEDVRRWVHSRLADTGCETWLAEKDGVPVALLLLEGDWLHSLYVDPGRTGEGIGATLLDLAKTLRPDGLGLWVFVSNTGARRFYERHGFGEVRRTDGSGNEEGEPDIEMAWPDPRSLEGLRRSIDSVDDRLAALLDERARLTALVQRVKPVPGEPGRDPAREDQIVARMARRAPALGKDRIRRIMQRVIEESLDAATQSRDASEQPSPSDG